MKYAGDQGYDRFSQHQTDCEGDEAAREEAREWADDDYNGTCHNCQDMVNSIMDAAGCPGWAGDIRIQLTTKTNTQARAMARLTSVVWVRVALSWLITFMPASSLLAEQRIQTPEQLLVAFYANLLSDKPVEDIPQIFVESTALAPALPGAVSNVAQNSKAATAAVWKYFRANKSLFLFPAIEAAQTTRKARLSYIFTTFVDATTFFDGAFCVELNAPLSKGGKEGVFKQVLFPLEKNTGPTGPRYLINVTSIRINGVLLDPAMEFDRSGNLYQQLGIADVSTP